MFVDMMKVKKGFSSKSIALIVFLVILIIVIVFFVVKNVINTQSSNDVSNGLKIAHPSQIQSATQIENSNQQSNPDNPITINSNNPETGQSGNSASLETLNPDAVNPETRVLTEADLPLTNLSADEKTQFIETYGKCCADESLSKSIGLAYQPICSSQSPSFACELFTVGDSDTGISFNPCVWKIGECFYKA